MIVQNYNKCLSTFGTAGIEDLVGDSTITNLVVNDAYDLRSYAFYQDPTLEYFSTRTIKNIGYAAFENCYNLVSVDFFDCMTIKSFAFTHCSQLTYANFPKCITIENQVFRGCSNLLSISFPNCTRVDTFTFEGCSSLSVVEMFNCSYIGQEAFENCKNLHTAFFSDCTIGWAAFQSCSTLNSLYLTGNSVVTLTDSNAFRYTPLATSSYTGKYGSIFVLSSLYSLYVASMFWNYYKDRFVSM